MKVKWIHFGRIEVIEEGWQAGLVFAGKFITSIMLILVQGICDVMLENNVVQWHLFQVYDVITMYF